MKVLNKIVMGAAALVLLTACGPSKCSFEKFQEEARAASQRDPGYAKLTIKGTIESNSLKITLDNVFEKKDSGWEMTKGDLVNGSIATALSQLRAVDYAGKEEDGVTYYVGGGFKVVEKDDDGTNTITFDKFGYVLTTKGKVSDYGKSDVKFSWKK